MDDPGWWCLLAGFVFVILTTFFSLANVSLRHILWVKLEDAFAKRGASECADDVRKRLSRWLSVTAILRMLSNLVLLLCVIAYFTMHKVEANNVVAVQFSELLRAFLVSGLILAVFSVAVPQAWGKYAGTQVLVRCYKLLRIVEYLSWPLIVVLNITDPIIRRLAGVSLKEDDNWLDEKQEELLNVVEEGEKEGVVDEEEKEMIASVLEFRDTTAGEIMTPRTDISGIKADASLQEAVEIVIREGHSRYPVYEQSIDNIIGMLYAKDLLQDLRRNVGDAGKAGNVNNESNIDNQYSPASTSKANPGSNNDHSGIRGRLREPFFVPESKGLRELLHDFQNQKVHLAVVLDEYGGTAGVVTIEDILEELVGEIVDEYEPPQNVPLKQIDKNSYEVDARYEVEQLNDKLALDIPEDDDYETVGGFVFCQMGSIPQRGEGFEYRNMRFTVIDAEKHRINRLRLEILDPSESPDDNDTDD